MKSWILIGFTFLALALIALRMQSNEVRDLKVELSECESVIVEYSDNAMELVCIERMGDLYDLVDSYGTSARKYLDRAYRCEAELEKRND